MELGRVLTFHPGAPQRRIFSFPSLNFIHHLSPLPHQTYEDPRVQQSQGWGIKQQKLFILAISNCRRGVGPQDRGTPARVTFRPILWGAKGVGGTCPYPSSPHRLFLPTGHFPTHPRWDLTSHQLLFCPTATAPFLSQQAPEPWPPLPPTMAVAVFWLWGGKPFLRKMRY